MIETVKRPDITIVAVLYWGVNRAPKAWAIVGRRALESPNLSCHFFDSCTPNRMNAIISAGTPPKMNIHRQP